MQAAIVEDEPHSAELLAHLIGKHCPDLEVTGVFTESPAALKAFLQEPPDLLLLDIEMPHLNGFDLLNRLAPFDFKVIFTTAYDKYAVKAFKYSAIDYLLKPIDIEELKAAIKKALSQAAPSLSQLALLQDNRLRQETPPERIALSTLEGLQFVETKSIIHCDSQGSYTLLYLTGNKKILLSKNLKEIEEILLPCGFLRIHNSHLIQLNHIDRYFRGEGGEVIMSNGSQLPVARSKKEEFLRRVSKI